MLVFPPIDNVFSTVRKFEIFSGNSLESHNEDSIVFFTSLDILVTFYFSAAKSASLKYVS